MERRGGFTLVELLVVMAVLTSLGLLGLALSSGGRSAMAGEGGPDSLAVCQGNLKQFALSLLMFIDENGGKTPEAHPGSGSTKNWYKNLAPNLPPLPGMKDWNNPGLVQGQFGPFRCPENAEQVYLSNFHGPQTNRTQSYGANTYRGFDENRYMGEKADDFKQPSKLIALFEANFQRCVVWNPDQNDSPEKVSELRHDGRMNVLFADGHVEVREGALTYRGAAVAGAEKDTAAGYENGALWYGR